jgi:hypothetical protein
LLGVVHADNEAATRAEPVPHLANGSHGELESANQIGVALTETTSSVVRGSLATIVEQPLACCCPGWQATLLEHAVRLAQPFPGGRANLLGYVRRSDVNRHTSHGASGATHRCPDACRGRSTAHLG